MLKSDKNEIAGVLDYNYDFYSRFLKNERDILVWLPNSSQTSNKKYPVLYMHDGQNLFNPSTSFSGYDWKVDETITDLSKAKMMEEIIVVGINNTKDRLEEYNFFTEKGKNYAKFIIYELMPFIEENYPVKTSRWNTGIMGSSMGGFYSLQLIWNYHNIFSKAGCLSSSFWINEGKIFDFIKSHGRPENDIKLYIDCGDAEKELIKDSRKMIKQMKTLGFNEGKDFLSHIEPNGKHTEFHWANRLHIPLSFLYSSHD